MSLGTAIEWCTATWNFLWGCKEVSPGCAHCYAAAMAARHKGGRARGLVNRRASGHRWSGKVRAFEERLLEPTTWARPQIVFVGSMTDLFYEEVPPAILVRAFEVMRRTPQHRFLLLTKRPKTAARYARDVLLPAWGELPAHLWWGTSVESAAELDRLDALREVPARTRWMSAEPLLGDLGECDLTGLRWVVAGGESGPGARPMHPAWVRHLRDWCGEHHVAFYFKQWGTHAPDRWLDGVIPVRALRRALDDGTPMVRTSKGVAGRELDGRTWDEVPDEWRVEVPVEREGAQQGLGLAWRALARGPEAHCRHVFARLARGQRARLVDPLGKEAEFALVCS